MLGVLLMKRSVYFVFLLMVCAMTLGCVSSFAQEDRIAPIQLALYPPAQIYAEDVSIVGLRLELYGINNRVSGLDIGLLNVTRGDQKGFQFGGCNLVDGSFGGIQLGLGNRVINDFSGWQGGLLNVAKGDVSALQTGPMNMSLLNMRGFQLGLINYARDMNGLQIGLLNTAQVMYGIQIGLINVISDKENLPVLPFVNASF